MPARLPLTREERVRFIEAGAELYKSLRPQLEGEHSGKYVAISVKTGRYVPTDDDAKLKEFGESLDAADFLWMTRIGSI